MNKIIVWLLASFVSLVIASEEKLMVERSVHGFEVSATESAFIAAILSENTASGTWQRLCVGIIIDDLNILAPARCAAVCRFPNVCVASVGVYGELHAGVEIKIVGGLHHDSWIEPTNIFNPFLILDDEIVADDSADNDSLVDIGLLYTERISFTELVQPMPLSEIEIESEENVIFYGWAVRVCLCINVENIEINKFIKPQAHRTLRSKNSTAIKCEVKEGKVAIKACITEKTISTYICGDYGKYYFKVFVFIMIFFVECSYNHTRSTVGSKRGQHIGRNFNIVDQTGKNKLIKVKRNFTDSY